MPTSTTSSGPAMPTTPTGGSTAFATTAAAAGRARARRQRAWPREPSPARSSPARPSAARSIQIGRHKIDRTRWSWAEVDNNPFFSPDPGIVETWSSYLDEVRKAGSSVGAVIEVVAEGVPAGWGAPIYGKLDQDLAARHDEHQRGQGRGDRRRHGRGRAHGRGERRRDPHGQRRPAACSSPTMPAASWAASPRASRSWRASPSSPPRRS